MTTTTETFESRVALTGFATCLAATIIGLVFLPFAWGYFTFALLAGGFAGIGWILAMRNQEKRSMGYIGLVATIVFQLVAKSFLAPNSSSLAYAVVFVAIAMTVGLGAALAYREFGKRG